MIKHGIFRRKQEYKNSLKNTKITNIRGYRSEIDIHRCLSPGTAINNLKKIAVHILKNDKLLVIISNLQEKNINKKEQYENDFQITLTDRVLLR